MAAFLMSTPLMVIAITRSDGVVTPRSPSMVIVSIVLVERIPLRRRMPVRFRLLALFPEVRVTVTLTTVLNPVSEQFSGTIRICPRIPIGRESALKMRSVWVRVPPGALWPYDCKHMVSSNDSYKAYKIVERA